jgi:hypothetical protein
MRILLPLLLVFALMGCGETLPSGTVLAKTYVPAHVDFITVSTGKSVSTIPVFNSARWLIVIGGKDSTGKEITNEVNVSAEVYGRLEVGQTYVRPTE